MISVAGFLIGLLVGLTGIGGGSLMTPLLVSVFGVAPVTSVGTDLWFAVITKLVATRHHSAKGLVDWRIARRLWIGSLPGAAVALLGVPSGASLRGGAVI